ncbi:MULTISPECIES: hypothetical protein [unclassified Streptomyces]|uniref:hypothetical protein n=1 Tax=unclassified Streptomyces TaxID=2593676 RepID=UPI000F5BE836|nr:MULTISPECIES: hypothetical protein [unclassified Streptomyces]WSG53814.1 hypothetical protein OHA38_30735 [Streptomyces sp. NBC_01732]WSP46149.1 hypothetical protein OG348_09855 [Streptomyces sp. NBC_01243]WSX04450.1 hypothetical protein OG355_30735 [Streptomyces sp. NBC_00987]
MFGQGLECGSVAAAVARGVRDQVEYGLGTALIGPVLLVGLGRHRPVRLRDVERTGRAFHPVLRQCVERGGHQQPAQVGIGPAGGLLGQGIDQLPDQIPASRCESEVEGRRDHLGLAPSSFGARGRSGGDR